MSSLKVANFSEFLIIDKKMICDMFYTHVKNKYKTQCEAAKHFGLSNGAISQVCSGRSLPNKAMLADMGLEHVSGYVRKQLDT